MESKRVIEKKINGREWDVGDNYIFGGVVEEEVIEDIKHDSKEQEWWMSLMNDKVRQWMIEVERNRQ